MEADNQHIRINAILEVLGKPKEYIEKKIVEYIDNIKEDENLMIIKEKVSDSKEQDNVWSIFAEIELVIKGVENVIGFCIDYMPSSIEILKPEEFRFEERIFTGFINDMLAKLHKVDMISKQLGTENNVLKKNMNNIIRNNILVLVKLGINTTEGLTRGTGIEQNQIKIFVDKLIEEKRIIEKEGTYSIAKNGTTQEKD